MSRSTRALLAALIAALFAVIAGIAAPSAHADDTFGAITWSEPQSVAGLGNGVTAGEAVNEAMGACTTAGGTACEVKVVSENGCGAIVVTGSTALGAAAPTLEEAKSVAQSRSPEGRVSNAICAGGPAAPAQKAPKDTDGDGLSDRDELGRFTNIFLPDTDLDGVSDGDEVNNGTNPLVIFDN